MEIKAELLYPYTEEERCEFIIEQNYNRGYEIRECVRTHSYEIEVEDTEPEVSEDLDALVEEMEEDTEVADEETSTEETETEETPEEPVRKTHTETITEEVIDLQAWGYTEEEQAEKERERLNLLSLTKREVFLAIYKDKKITPEQIKAMIPTEEGKIEFDYANDYFRGNPLIDQLGKALGYTSEDLDYLFENGELPINEAE